MSETHEATRARRARQGCPMSPPRGKKADPVAGRGLRPRTERTSHIPIVNSNGHLTYQLAIGKVKHKLGVSSHRQSILTLCAEAENRPRGPGRTSPTRRRTKPVGSRPEVSRSGDLVRQARVNWWHASASWPTSSHAGRLQRALKRLPAGCADAFGITRSLPHGHVATVLRSAGGWPRATHRPDPVAASAGCADT